MNIFLSWKALKTNVVKNEYLWSKGLNSYGYSLLSRLVLPQRVWHGLSCLQEKRWDIYVLALFKYYKKYTMHQQEH